MKRAFLGALFPFVVLACGGDDGAPSGATNPTEPGGPPPGGPPPVSTGGNETGPVMPPATAPKRVAFIAMGDAGTGSADQKKVANVIEGVCAKRGCDFVQLLGDNLYDSGAESVDDAIWQTHFEVPYAAINLPFYAVLGNHDYGHSGTGTDFGKGKNEVNYTAKSTKWKMPAAYYHHTIENLEMFALDTNKILLDGLGTSSSDQEGDFPKWIAASTAEWKIAVGHHPYKSNGPHGNAGDYDDVILPGPWQGKKVKSFLESHVCGKVDLYLCGHDHSRQWLNVSCQGTELAVSGAGAKATELPGSTPSLVQSLELGFLYIVIEGKKLTAEFIDDAGNVEFTHVVNKP
jgi:hypothetical protein